VGPRRKGEGKEKERRRKGERRRSFSSAARVAKVAKKEVALMRRMIMLFTVAAVMAVIMVALAASAFANCGDAECSVGAAGTGGEKSEGKAQGFREEGPSDNPATPGRHITNSGNDEAGRVEFSGSDTGTLSGTARDDTVRGRGTGFFGDWAGQCELDDFPDEC
jgi:hypothetical protein